MQQFYNAITARGDYPPVAVAAGSSLSVTFASQGTLHAFNLAPAVPVTARWGGEQRAATLGGQLWGTYSAAAESIVMHPLKDALTTTTSDPASGSTEFAAATTATLAKAPISATSFNCAGNHLTLRLKASGANAILGLTREKPAT